MNFVSRPISRRRIPTKVLASGVLAFALTLVLLPTVSVSAYNRSAVVTYADTYWKNYNGLYNSYTNDCQNFVSQSEYAGNYSFDGWPNGSRTNDANWWFDTYYRIGTQTWQLVQHYRSFLIIDVPGGYLWSSLYGSQYGTSSGLQTADVIMYDFNDGQGLSHSTVQVRTGGSYVDPNSGWWGDEVDSHSTDRQSAYWALHHITETQRVRRSRLGISTATTTEAIADENRSLLLDVQPLVWRKRIVRESWFRLTKRRAAGLLLVAIAGGAVFVVASLRGSASQDEAGVRGVVRQVLVLQHVLSVPPTSYTGGNMSEATQRLMKQRTVDQLRRYMRGEPLARYANIINSNIGANKSGQGRYLDGGVDSLVFSDMRFSDDNTAIVDVRAGVWAKVGQQHGAELVVATPHNLADYTFTLTKVGGSWLVSGESYTFVPGYGP